MQAQVFAGMDFVINKRIYPTTWTGILEVINQLGYRKVLPRIIRLQAPGPDLTKVEP